MDLMKKKTNKNRKRKEIKFQESEKDLQLMNVKKEQEAQLKDLDQTAQTLAKRDIELPEVREKREREFKELEEKTKELEKTRRALLNILEDVGLERQRAEEERNRTLMVINNLSDGLLVFDTEGKLSLINPQAEKLLNLKGKDLVGKTVFDLVLHPAISPVVNVLREESKGVFRKELNIKENLVLEITVIPILNEKEEFGTLVILHDVTREKMVERMKTEFVSLTAHQLRTPLSAIKWTLRIILDRELGEISAEQEEFLKKTYQSNERMISLINDLLNVTRIEEGRYLQKPILANFEELVQSVVNYYKEELERKKIRFELRKPEKPLPLVSMDVEKITMVLQNLIDNAVRYTPEGGEVTVSLWSDKNKVQCEVKDFGIGIPKDQQARVFSRFFRATNALRRETEGTGLGLFIAKNIIEAHGGRIWFESEENMGSTFYFTLPVK